MGTRGYVVFLYKGKYYAIYNHFDSYDLYKNLKKEIIDAIKNGTFDSWKSKVENIVCVDTNLPPTDEQVEKLKPYTDLKVSSKNKHDWYCLLRETQGSFVKVLDAGYIENHLENKQFESIFDMFNEYTCVLDLDLMKFISYVGDKIVKIDDLNEFIKMYSLGNVQKDKIKILIETTLKRIYGAKIKYLNIQTFYDELYDDYVKLIDILKEDTDVLSDTQYRICQVYSNVPIINEDNKYIAFETLISDTVYDVIREYNKSVIKDKQIFVDI